MIKHNQDGAVSGLAISLVLTIVLLIAAISFGAWSFASRSDFKNNTDSKVKDAVAVAKQQESAAKDAQFIQDAKKPLRTYSGPEAYGSIQISYPKTWSGYVVSSGGQSNNALVDGYFFPGIVPSTSDPASVFSLRLQVISQAYAQTLAGITSAASSSQQGFVPPVITPYALPKVPKAIGIKLTGTLPNGKQGTMVVLPLRSQTLEVWAETGQFTADFENNILPNFTFSP